MNYLFRLKVKQWSQQELINQSRIRAGLTLVTPEELEQQASTSNNLESNEDTNQSLEEIELKIQLVKLQLQALELSSSVEES